MDCTTYKSPVDKLLKCFRKGRDGWKVKCQEAKRSNKLLANQTRAVEKSREHWKQVARAAQRQVQELERQVQDLKCTARA